MFGVPDLSGFRLQKPTKVGTPNLFLCKADDFIKIKTLAGRPQDLADIERLENEES